MASKPRQMAACLWSLAKSLASGIDVLIYMFAKWIANSRQMAAFEWSRRLVPNS